MTKNEALVLIGRFSGISAKIAMKTNEGRLISKTLRDEEYRVAKKIMQNLTDDNFKDEELEAVLK